MGDILIFLNDFLALNKKNVDDFLIFSSKTCIMSRAKNHLFLRASADQVHTNADFWLK